MVIAGIGNLAFRPWLGKMIDRFGERPILMLDGVALGLICLGYGYAEWLLGHDTGRWLAYVCFVLDDMLFAVGDARTIYAARIAKSKEEITSTLALGVTIDHTVSMSIPALGGFAWIAWDYPTVFLGAAVVAVFVFITASRVPPRGPSVGEPPITPDLQRDP